MSRAANNALINAKFELKMLKSGLARERKGLIAKEKAQKKELLQLMKDGADQVLLDMKTEALSKTIGNIRKSQMNSARLDMFSDKIDEAHTQQRIGANMINVTRALGRVTKSMQLEQIESVMMDLGKQYEDIDVMTSVLDTSTSETTAATTSPEEIVILQRKLADEAGLELSNDLASAGTVSTAPVKSGPTAEQLEESSQRLKALRQHA